MPRFIGKSRKKPIEDDLRNKIRNVFGKDIEWVEPAWGSSVGLPDCNLIFGDEKYPVELKYWAINKFGLKCELRPSQIRYHVMGAKKGNRSAILFAIDVPGSVGEFTMYIIPNTKCPKNNYALKIDDCKFVGVRLDDDRSIRRRLENLLRSESFWK